MDKKSIKKVIQKKGKYSAVEEKLFIIQAKELLMAVVDLYNSELPHMSIGYLTPNQVYQSKEPMKIQNL